PAQGRSSHDRASRTVVPHDRAHGRGLARHPRLRPVQGLPPWPAEQTRCDLPASGADVASQAPNRVLRRPYPLRARHGSFQCLHSGAARPGVHELDRTDIWQRRHHSHLGHREESRSGIGHSKDTTVTEAGASFITSLPPEAFIETAFGVTVFGASKVLTLSIFGAASVWPVALAILP